MNAPVQIIDLFAGPGGLGEGFSAYVDKRGQPSFKIGLSIEMEASAHRTLELRAFYRQFPAGEAPDAYYEFLAGKLGADPRRPFSRIGATRSRRKRLGAKRKS
jgi:DNA (cytosine-5)-methyltransferase 1